MFGLIPIALALLAAAGAPEAEPTFVDAAGVGPTPVAGTPVDPAIERVPSKPGVAQGNDGSWTVFPLVSFAPETSVQGSAFVIYSFGGQPGATPLATSSRSTVTLLAAYTLKNQFLMSLAPSLYLDQGKWRLSGSLQALWYPDVVYATGPDSAAQSAEQYTQRAFVVNASVERRLIGHLKAGGQLLAFTARMTKVEPGRLLDQGLLIGSHGGDGVGIGPLVVWDDRSREFAPQHGGRHMLSLMFFPRVAGADFSFSQLTVDLRQYVPSWWSGQVIAFQLFSQFSMGDPPFQFTPTIGGDGRMRGFFASRFRDRDTAVAQVEYRAALWWRLGLVVFGGVGDVAGRIADFHLGHFRTAGGGGLRVALDQKEGINVRVDVGHSSVGDTNLYVTVGEGF